MTDCIVPRQRIAALTRLWLPCPVLSCHQEAEIRHQEMVTLHNMVKLLSEVGVACCSVADPAHAAICYMCVQCSLHFV
jgi:hypothetical protein